MGQRQLIVDAMIVSTNVTTTYAMIDLIHDHAPSSVSAPSESPAFLRD
jgi:hypothetical protein